MCADFRHLLADVRKLERAGIDWLHFDIMDDHFVPNLTFGPGFVEAIRKVTSLPLDVHLMVSNPQDFIEEFIHAGADWVSFHIEATPHIHRLVFQVMERPNRVLSYPY